MLCELVLELVERRLSDTLFLLILFGLIGMMASAITILVARLSRQNWTRELRGMLHGEKRQRPEFQGPARCVGQGRKHRARSRCIGRRASLAP